MKPKMNLKEFVEYVTTHKTFIDNKGNEKKYTKYRLANELGLSPSTVTAWSKGTTTSTYPLIANKILTKFGIDVDDCVAKHRRGRK